MITLNQMLEQGVNIEGHVDVRVERDGERDFERAFYGDALNMDASAGYMDLPIEYIYAVEGVGLVIELKMEGE